MRDKFPFILFELAIAAIQITLGISSLASSPVLSIINFIGAAVAIAFALDIIFD